MNIKIFNNNNLPKKIACRMGHEYSLLEPYQGAWHRIWCRHNVCGHTFKIAPASFGRGRNKIKCPYCIKNGNVYKMDSLGRIDRLVTVRCPKKHRYKVFQYQLPDVAVGKITCPICKKLKALDPLYKHARVEFIYEFRGGHLV